MSLPSAGLAVRHATLAAHPSRGGVRPASLSRLRRKSRAVVSPSATVGELPSRAEAAGEGITSPCGAFPGVAGGGGLTAAREVSSALGSRLCAVSLRAKSRSITPSRSTSRCPGRRGRSPSRATASAARSWCVTTSRRIATSRGSSRAASHRSSRQMSRRRRGVSAEEAKTSSGRVSVRPPVC